MARIFITGSSDGLGLMAGRLLAEQGQAVVLHARNDTRAEATRAALRQAEAVLVGDLSTLAAMHDVADQANGQGRFDAVIHNGKLDDICRVDVFVRNMEQFSEIHAVRRQYFKSPPPASTMVEVAKFMTPDALIEISAIAILA